MSPARSAAAAVAALLAPCLPAAAQPEGTFYNSLDQARHQASYSGMPILLVIADAKDPIVQKVVKEALADKELAPLAKKFVRVMLPPADGSLQKRLQGKGISSGVIMILDWKGDELDTLSLLEGASASGLNKALASNNDRYVGSLTEELSKAKPDAVPAILGKLANVSSPKSAETLIDFAKREDAPAAQRVAAIKGLANQTAGAEEMVPLLVDKNVNIRTTAAKSLQTQGPAAVPALLSGLGSDNPELRSACYGLAATMTRYPKSRTVTFWKSGPEAERAKVLDDWREWWNTKKPATK